MLGRNCLECEPVCRAGASSVRVNAAASEPRGTGNLWYEAHVSLRSAQESTAERRLLGEGDGKVDHRAPAASDPFRAFRGSACRHPAEPPASKHDSGAGIIGLKRCRAIREALVGHIEAASSMRPAVSSMEGRT